MIALVALVLFPLVLGGSTLIFKKRFYSICTSVIISATTLVTAVVLLSKRIQNKLVLTGFFGVEVIFDELSAIFLLTSGTVTLLVLIDSMKDERLDGFRAMLPMLMAVTNASFISYDFFNVYVTLELVTIIAFILIGIQMLPKQLWGGIKYLLLGNTGMLFYLIGVALYYEEFGTFSMSKFAGATALSLAMITIGLFIKSGIFLSGLWLPSVHGEAATPVSALLSGVVVKAGVYPILRLSHLNHEYGRVVGIFGLLSVFLGGIFALTENDSKRTLAYSTVSQIGYMLQHPVSGAIYAFVHGITKSWLFLRVGRLKTRDLSELRAKGVPSESWFPIFVASLAVSGLPTLGVYAAKASVMLHTHGWEKIVFYIAGGLTAAVFAKFIFLPVKKRSEKWKVIGLVDTIALSSLLMVDIVLKHYDPTKISIAMLTIVCGWLLYRTLYRTLRPLPRTLETIDHLIGMSVIVSIILMFLWGVAPW